MTSQGLLPQLVLLATKAQELFGIGNNEVTADSTVQEETEFDVILCDFGPNTIQVIKVVRELTGLGLQEAKKLVEAAPQRVMSAVPKVEVEATKAKLEAVGATVRIR